MPNKMKLSRGTRYIINVEQLLSQISMLKNQLDRMHFEWYPKELHDAISIFAFDDINNVMHSLVDWIESHVDED